jgi:hypothetical protein
MCLVDQRLTCLVDLGLFVCAWLSKVFFSAWLSKVFCMCLVDLGLLYVPNRHRTCA